MAITTTKHVHKLRRHKYTNGETVYFCTSDCKFKISTKLALGKTVRCSRCDDPFTMNERSIREAKPHCNNCIKGRKKPANKLRAEDLSDLRSRLDSKLQKIKQGGSVDTAIESKDDLL